MSATLRHTLSRITIALALLLPATAFGQSPKALQAQLQEKSARFFQGSQPGGVVLVRKGDTVLLRQAYGMADVENQVAMKPDKVFRLASVTKQFTAIATLRLIDAGKLSLDQPVGSIETTLPEAMGKVTIRQLLTHTSGIKNISSIPESRAARRNEATADELIAFFKDRPLEFAPGTRFAYSNSNYILLTRVIERISGESYADHMQRAIFAPLGMRDTRYGSHTAVIPNRAHGYQRKDGQLLNADFISMTQPQGAGGLVTTADDLNKWDLALYGDKLVSRPLLDQAFGKVTLSDGTQQPYGFGWMVSQVQGLASVEHGGFINGFQSFVLRIPEQRLFVTVLTNAEFLTPDDLAVELAALVAGRPYDKTPVAGPDHSPWQGRYDFGNGVQRDIVVIAGKLHSQRVGADPIELMPAADGRYYLGEGHDYVSFARRPDGKAVMTLHNRLMGDSVGLK